MLFPLASFTMQRTSIPLCFPSVVKLYVAVVAVVEPEFFQLSLGNFTCHWYLSPVPSAFTANLAWLPTDTLQLDGWPVILSASAVLHFASLLVTLFPLASFTMQRTSIPLCFPSVVKLYVAVVAVVEPEFFQLSLGNFTCHSSLCLYRKSCLASYWYDAVGRLPCYLERR